MIDGPRKLQVGNTGQVHLEAEYLVRARAGNPPAVRVSCTRQGNGYATAGDRAVQRDLERHQVIGADDPVTLPAVVSATTCQVILIHAEQTRRSHDRIASVVHHDIGIEPGLRTVRVLEIDAYRYRQIINRQSPVEMIDLCQHRNFQRHSGRITRRNKQVIR